MADGTVALKEDQENLQYIRKHDMHHLFEKLASDVLQFKPKELIPFLIEVLMSMAPDTNSGAAAAGSGGFIGDGQGPKYDPTQEDRRPIDGKEDAKKKLKVSIAVFGIGNAGKTTLLSALGGEIDRETTPTIGFTPVRMSADRYDVVLYDLGGGKQIRGVWPSYFSDIHGIIYVVDHSDPDTVEESLEAIQTIITDDRSSGKPLLLFANKQDLSPEMALEDLEARFNVAAAGQPFKVAPISALEAGHAAHKNIETGIEWLLDAIASQYEALSRRIKEQLAIDKEKRKKEFEEQKERVRKEKEREAEEAAAAGK
ncbi:ADP-ribosylation factor-like protein 13B [Diplonema papillatum]|nr:ADP-ribosylation factor-like protein 13B [Diplonema papillatum]